MVFEECSSWNTERSLRERLSVPVCHKGWSLFSKDNCSHFCVTDRIIVYRPSHAFVCESFSDHHKVSRNEISPNLSTLNNKNDVYYSFSKNNWMSSFSQIKLRTTIVKQLYYKPNRLC
ncbi:hypothetical protein EG68_10077 [Paragonimus skrjabini miyazakii]|uniref:Uncharacterized protein n=1 Tax=Paragonimus skrjabini miyazakii TaxID=59628 RepID=A0A8S9YGF5_9TREM|nr:hypothetical protein EG68_10077 [Paragonimus skrjabini miyazakii]